MGAIRGPQTAWLRDGPAAAVVFEGPGTARLPAQIHTELAPQMVQSRNRSLRGCLSKSAVCAFGHSLPGVRMDLQSVIQEIKQSCLQESLLTLLNTGWVLMHLRPAGHPCPQQAGCQPRGSRFLGADGMRRIAVTVHGAAPKLLRCMLTSCTLGGAAASAPSGTPHCSMMGGGQRPCQANALSGWAAGLWQFECCW